LIGKFFTTFAEKHQVALESFCLIYVTRNLPTGTVRDGAEAVDPAFSLTRAFVEADNQLLQCCTIAS